MKNIRNLSFILILLINIFLFFACEEKVSFDPENPVVLRFAAYYNDVQLKIFTAKIEEFNSTKGKEMGIIVEPISIPSVPGINDYLIQSANDKAGSETFPDIFVAYKSVIPYFNGKIELLNYKDFLSDDELSYYMEKLVDEGYLSKDKSILNMLPLATSTEIMYVNKTDFEKFAKKNNVDADLLSSYEGLIEISEKYYNYTDAETPDIPNDGKSLIGLDSKVESVFSIVQSMGESLIVKKDGKFELNFNEKIAKKLWDIYIVPSYKGYMAKYSKFTSEDLQSGKLLITIASTAGSSYISDFVYDEELQDQKKVDFITLPPPNLKNSKSVFVQQGGGIFISKSDKLKETAAVEFIKWLTDKENNIEFALKCSYIPVRNDNTDSDYIEKKVAEFGVDPKIKSSIITSIDHISESEMYIRPDFDNYEKFRTELIKILEYNIKEKRADILNEAEKNNNYEELIDSVTNEESFTKWYTRAKEMLSAVFDDKK